MPYKFHLYLIENSDKIFRIERLYKMAGFGLNNMTKYLNSTLKGTIKMRNEMGQVVSEASHQGCHILTRKLGNICAYFLPH